jgi:hypothetical protein
VRLKLQVPLLPTVMITCWVADLTAGVCGQLAVMQVVVPGVWVGALVYPCARDVMKFSGLLCPRPRVLLEGLTLLQKEP